MKCYVTLPLSEKRPKVPDGIPSIDGVGDVCDYVEHHRHLRYWKHCFALAQSFYDFQFELVDAVSVLRHR